MENVENGQRVRLSDGREGTVVNRQSMLFVACVELEDGTLWEERWSLLTTA
jgi:hypothetical protein